MHSLTFDSPLPLSLFLFLFLPLSISPTPFLTLPHHNFCLILFPSLRRRYNRPFLPLVCTAFVLSSFNLYLSSLRSSLRARVSVLFLDAAISSFSTHLLASVTFSNMLISSRGPSSARVGRWSRERGRSDPPMNARTSFLRAACIWSALATGCFRSLSMITIITESIRMYNARMRRLFHVSTPLRSSRDSLELRNVDTRMRESQTHLGESLLNWKKSVKRYYSMICSIDSWNADVSVGSLNFWKPLKRSHRGKIRVVDL